MPGPRRRDRRTASSRDPVEVRRLLQWDADTFIAVAIDLSRSRIRYRGPSSSAHASSSWRAVHSAVGCSVTLKCTSRRRLWVSTMSTNRTRKVAVGTVKKSNAIRSGAWFFKNVRHACDGGLRGRTMYFDTVACETVRPSFSSSPWILGAPQGICAAHPPNQIAELGPNPGPTVSGPTLPRPVASESLPVPADHGLRPYHLQRMSPTRPQPREENPKDPVHLRQPWPRLTRLPHSELLPQRQVLQRQLAVRTNRASQCPQEDSDPSDHDRPNSGSVRRNAN